MATRKNGIASAEMKAERDKQTFTKEQIIASARYANRRDLVEALLNDGEKYTMIDIDKKIDDYMKGKVK